MEKRVLSIAIALIMSSVIGCASKAGNMAVGAGAAGAAYEYSNKRQIDQLDQDLRDGKISKDEYDRRRKEIESRSIVY